MEVVDGIRRLLKGLLRSGRHKSDGTSGLFASTLSAKTRHGLPGQIGPHYERIESLRFNADRKRIERRTMIIDRENDHYLQEWRTVVTRKRTY